jgi:phage terminase Nu1 subunit (DNA packaging protein)
VRDLVEFVQQWLGARLTTLLSGLLFEVRFGVVKEILDDGLLNSERRVAKAIEEVQKAKNRHEKLKVMKKDFLKFARSHPDMVVTRFGYVIPDASDSEDDSN